MKYKKVEIIKIMPTTNIRNIRILINLYEINIGNSTNSSIDSELKEKQNKIFKDLLYYYRLKNRCERGVERLKAILVKELTLEQRAIREWIINHEQLGQKELLGFYFKYLDYGDDPNRNLFIPALNLFVERKDFIPIIQFWELHYLLFWNQYHIEPDKRTQEDVNSYYSSPLNPKAPSDLYKVLRLLAGDFSAT